MKIQAPPEWGIEPVPDTHRILRLLDYFALWSSLGVGLLVLLAGTLLVPGMGLRQALLAIGIGTVVGSLLLAMAGVVGSDHAIPTMVMLRPVLGLRGSYLPSVLNIVQLIGWGAFEIIIMAQAADAIARSLLGFSAVYLWTFFFAAWCTLLALGGPLAVVRQWLEKFAIWLVYGITIYLTFYLFRHYDVGALLRSPGSGDLPFWLGVDLVVAMPISWMPLVADYNRFSRRPGPAFWGTFLGYTVANVWFYALGALFVLALRTSDLIPAILSVAGGWLALLLILVDETDNGFADIYSAAVSSQNLFPRAQQWWLTIGIGAVCFVLAATVPIAQYENFLLLIGSVFVPLFGVLAADYFLLRGRRYKVEELYRPQGEYWYRAGFNVWAMLVWGLGIAVYQAIANRAPWLGASVPSFLASLVVYWILGKVTKER
ncbi:MAG: putative hydroxymethylpyrimidine transporter CytX [Chloroflexia bacterium]